MSIFTRILRRSPAPLTKLEEAQLRLAADVARRKIMIGDDYARRRAAALKGAL